MNERTACVNHKSRFVLRFVSRFPVLVMDVDGTLTDGKIHISPQGELFKSFDVKDGYAIHSLLRPNGIEPVIITGRTSEIVRKRCEELNIVLVYQGISDKLRCLSNVLQELSEWDGERYAYENCAYIGDDLIDLECMQQICAAGGVFGCPADAVEEIKQVSDYICTKKAGNGAVREFINWIINYDIRKDNL